MYAKIENDRWRLTRTSVDEVRYRALREEEEVVHRKRVYKSAGTLPIGAEEVTQAMQEEYNYTSEELEYLERRIFVPARAARKERERLAQEHERDPSWRLADALSLLSDAVAVCREHGVGCDAEKIKTIRAELSILPELDSTATTSDAAGRIIQLMSNAVSEIGLAANLAREMGLPGSPNGVRAAIGKQWQELSKAQAALLPFLQKAGYVKKRGAKSPV
nr:hypothetical protein [uncultured Massilia sp.]